tara:strand:+ start:125 stop:1978 length:1854 start_codon:yes stop_codon:yes gene_type:complete
MNAFDVVMLSQSVSRAPLKQPRRARKRNAGAQKSLMAYIRPRTWIAQPLELCGDVVVTIAETLMRSADCEKKVYHLKALALVNRVCARAVASTLNQVRTRLQHNGNASARAHTRLIRCRRGEKLLLSDEPRAPREHLDALAAENERLRKIHESYMEEVGIPMPRRLALSLFADRVWFHNNVALLGHLGDCCELCNGPLFAQKRPPGYSFRDGPVMLVACQRCKQKSCVDLALSYALRFKETVKVRIEKEETEANNYARALLSKQSAHVKRMRSKRATRMVPTKLGKCVHLRDMTDAMCLCYWNSLHRMSLGPWTIELWHTLPKEFPQDLTFSALVGVRDSDAARHDARAHAAHKRERRVRASKQRAALAVLHDRFGPQRRAVKDVVVAGHFDGWVQTIDLCMIARAFDVRWLFRWKEPQHANATPPDWHAQMRKLLDMDETVRDAAARRVGTVAEVLRRGFLRTTMQRSYWRYDSSLRSAIKELLCNFPTTFLNRGAGVVNELVEKLLRAGVELRLCASSSPQHRGKVAITYGLKDTRGTWRRLELVSYYSSYTCRRMSEAMGISQPCSDLTPEIVRQLQQQANHPLCSDYETQTTRNAARAAIFALPSAWPDWLTR